jgi:hypothetical protein
MELKPGELADKLSILHLKCLYAKDPESRKFMQKEFDEAFQEWNEMVKKPEAWHLFFELARANGDIWQLEKGIRDLPDDVEIRNYEEIGKRAMQIRDINKTRIKLCNEINAIYGANPELKINHASE